MADASSFAKNLASTIDNVLPAAENLANGLSDLIGADSIELDDLGPGSKLAFHAYDRARDASNMFSASMDIVRRLTDPNTVNTAKQIIQNYFPGRTGPTIATSFVFVVVRQALYDFANHHWKSLEQKGPLNALYSTNNTTQQSEAEPKKLYAFETQVNTPQERFDHEVDTRFPDGERTYHHNTQAWIGELTDAEAAALRSETGWIYICEPTVMMDTNELFS